MIGRGAFFRYVILSWIYCSFSLSYFCNCTASRVLLEPAQVDNRIKLYIATASYELTYGTSGTRSGAGVALTSTTTRGDSKLDQNKIKAAGTFIEPVTRLVRKSEDSNQSLAGVAPLVYAITAANNLYQWMTVHGNQVPNTSPTSLTSSSSSTNSSSTPTNRSTSGTTLTGSTGGTTISGTDGHFQELSASIRAISEAIRKGNDNSYRLGRIPLLTAEGILAWNQNDYVKARERFAEIIQLNPHHCGPGPRIGLGLALYKLGHYAAAKNALRRAVQIDPHHPAALVALSFLEAHGQELAVSMGLVDENTLEHDKDSQSKAVQRSLVLAKKAITTVPDHPQGLLELSHAYFSNWTEVISPTTAAPVTVIATRGSRRLILSDVQCLNKFLPNTTIKLLVNIKGKGILVPMRLTASNATAMVPRANLGLVNSMIDTIPGDSLPVLNCRQVWGQASVQNVRIRMIDLSMSEKQARLAIASTRSSECRAEAYFALGRALHASGSYADAGVAYRQCLKINKDHTAALTGCAQCDVYKNAMDDAIKLLKRVLELRPDDRSATKLLATIYTKQQNMEKALDYARRASDLAPWDVSAAVLYSTLLMRQEGRPSVERALKVNEHAVKLLQEQGSVVPAALYSNLGVLHARLGMYLPSVSEKQAQREKADKEFSNALTQIAMEKYPGAVIALLTAKETHESAALSPAGVTVAFNIARLREQEGRPAEAEEMYSKLLGVHPSYLDCHIRLALIARSRGDFSTVHKHLQEVIAKGSAAANSVGGATSATVSSAAASAVVTALVLQGNLAERDGQRSLAREKYLAALKEPGFAEDPYALLSIANMDFQEIYRLRPEDAAVTKDEKYRSGKHHSASENTRDTILRKAFDEYKSVLKRYPTNVYAANGLGSVLAEQGRLEHAKEVFGLVREAAQECSPVYLNLAHTQVALGAHDAAIQMYSHVLRKFGGGSGSGGQTNGGTTDGSVGSVSVITGTPEDQVKVLTLMARAQVDARRFQDACSSLVRAVQLCPYDLRIQFNLAYTQEEEGVRIANEYLLEQHAIAAAAAAKQQAKLDGNTTGNAPVKRVTATITAEHLEKAVSYLRSSLRTFKWLLTQLEAKRQAVEHAETVANQMVENDLTGQQTETANDTLQKARQEYESLGFTTDQLTRFITLMENNRIVETVEGYLANAQAKAAVVRAEMAKRSAASSLRQREREAEKLVKQQEEERLKEEMRQKALELKSHLQGQQLKWQQVENDLAMAKAASVNRTGSGKKGTKPKRNDGSDSDSSGSSSDSDDSARKKKATDDKLHDLFGSDESSGSDSDSSSSESSDSSSSSGSSSSTSGNSRSSTGKGKKPNDTVLDDLFGDTTPANDMISTTNNPLTQGNNTTTTTTIVSSASKPSKLKKHSNTDNDGDMSDSDAEDNNNDNTSPAEVVPSLGNSSRKRNAAVIDDDDDDDE